LPFGAELSSIFAVDFMQTKHFRTTTNEYCHITNDYVFIFNSKEPSRIPVEHDLSNAWSIKNVLNIVLFAILLFYVMGSVNYYGIYFFKEPINYGGLVLLFLLLVRIKENFMSSNTPVILRNTIKAVYLKKPKFSYARVVIYFVGPEGKVLRRKISVKYPIEAEKVLKEEGLL
jgi:hypothetical protein